QNWKDGKETSEVVGDEKAESRADDTKIDRRRKAITEAMDNEVKAQGQIETSADGGGHENTISAEGKQEGWEDELGEAHDGVDEEIVVSGAMGDEDRIGDHVETGGDHENNERGSKSGIIL